MEALRVLLLAAFSIAFGYTLSRFVKYLNGKATQGQPPILGAPEAAPSGDLEEVVMQASASVAEAWADFTGGAMEQGDLIRKIQARVQMCRRLAQSTTDVQTAETLRQMAAEGEADIARLRAEIIGAP